MMMGPNVGYRVLTTLESAFCHERRIVNMKEVVCEIPGLSFRITGTGMKTTKNVYVIHTESQLPVVGFVSVKNPSTLLHVANEVLYHPTYWTKSSDELTADLASLRKMVFPLEQRVHTDEYGNKRAK
jgi:hypothetical protein